MNLFYRTSQDLRQRGFLLLEMIVACTVLISLMSFGSSYLQKNLQQSVNRILAHQMSQITLASHQYVEDHYVEYSKDINPKDSVTLSELLDGGYVNEAFVQTNRGENLYRQKYNIAVEQKKNPNSGDVAYLQILITTSGGKAIDELSLRNIAAIVGGDGGYTSGTRKDTIMGSLGNWEINSSKAQAGHLASLTTVSDKTIWYNSNPIDEDKLLHRVADEKHPEYNKMEADLEIAQDKKIFIHDEKNKKNRFELSYGSGLKINSNSSSNTMSSLNSADLVMTGNDKSTARLSSNRLEIRDSNSNSYVAEIKKNEINIYHTPGSGKKTTIDSSGAHAYEPMSDTINGVNIDKSYSDSTSRLLPNSIKLPIFRPNAMTIANAKKIAVWLCGNKTGFFNKNYDGRMFIVGYASGSQLENLYHVYVCLAGDPMEIQWKPASW